MFLTKNQYRASVFEAIFSPPIVIFSSLLIQLVSLESLFLMRLLHSLGIASVTDIHSKEREAFTPLSAQYGNGLSILPSKNKSSCLIAPVPKSVL